MRRRRVDSNLERQFLIALITSKPFLASVAPVLDVNLIRTKHVATVMRWCVEHWESNGEAPGKGIETIFHAWAESESREEAEVELVAELLGQISDQSEEGGKINVPHLLDQMGDYLSSRKLGVLNETLSASLMRGETGAALREVSEFRAIDLGQGCGINPLNDRAAWERAFADPAESLIRFPGDAGRFLNRALTRDSLIAIQGPEKRGKTFWCLEFTFRALRNRRRVALFEVGDLSESQLMLRMGVRLTGLPLWKEQVGQIGVPHTIERVKDEEAEGGGRVIVETKEQDCPRTVNRRACLRACKQYLRARGLARTIPHLMISVHPNSSINVDGIEGILSRWEHEKGFVADVIVIDYADILAPEKGQRDFRHQVNDTWMALRQMSQEHHALVISPTQATRESYKATTQQMEHASEDKRKMSHVTGMLGLNQSPDEKQWGIMRLNWVLLRESPFHIERCLWVAHCFPLARACCCATL